MKHEELLDVVRQENEKTGLFFLVPKGTSFSEFQRRKRCREKLHGKYIHRDRKDGKSRPKKDEDPRTEHAIGTRKVVLLRNTGIPRPF